jgi:hypothetical protein
MSDKLFNITAIILEFLSFWFVAPELLGEERLRKLENWIENFLGFVPHVFETLESEQINSKQDALVFTLHMLFAIGGLYLFVRIFNDNDLPNLLKGQSLGWTGLVVWATVYFSFMWITPRLASAGLKLLAGNDKLRQALLILGAILFIVSTGMQLYLAI